MNNPVLILYLEDNPRDAELVRDTLSQAHLNDELTVARDRPEYEAALVKTRFDLIISDYALPDYDGLAALSLAQQQQPGVPFILISGTLGEDRAVECLHRGATDYVLKQRLDRLAPAVRRALAEAAERRERKRAEEASREKEHLLSESQRLGHVGSWLWDMTGPILWSEEMYRLYGISPETFTPTVASLLALIYLDDRPTMQAWITACAAGEKPGKFEFRINLPDGTLRFLEAYGEVVHDAEHKPSYMAGTVLDITERKQADAQLRQQTALLDATSDAIILKDLAGHILYWNRGAEQLYGWPAAEAIGRISHRLLQTNLEKFDEAIQFLLKKSYWRGEMSAKTKDRRELILDARWTLILDDAGQPKSILTINTDITERKKLEAQLLRNQRMESIGTLAGGIAHDLNNSLAPAMMSLTLLRDKVTDSEGRGLLVMLESGLQRACDLVRQVLSFARGVEGQRIMVDLNHLVREMRQIMVETFPKNLAVHDLRDRGLWPILGDATQLHQVLMNLCVNARDAMPHGGQLSVTTENITLDETYAHMNPDAKTGPYVLLTVTDTGTGIPWEIQDRIFDPFFTTKEIGKGTGLGLSTTFTIVKNHGGFIRLHSELGKGTTFKVYLPACSAASADQSAIPVQKQTQQGHGELVLVVDDEASIRSIVQANLKYAGYRVLLAVHGGDALSLYAQHRDEVAVVLIDMVMPIMDGPTTIVALRAMNPKVRIIASSGTDADDVVAQARAAGVQYFIPKPYTAEALFAILHQVLHPPA